MVQLGIIIERANTTQRIDKLKARQSEHSYCDLLLRHPFVESYALLISVAILLLGNQHAATVFTLCALLHISPNMPLH
jgi:hypothetical protein